MAHRVTVHVTLAVLAAACSALAPTPSASADVGVAEVASLARSAFPGRVLFDMRYRDRGDERFWATSSINSFNTLFYTMRVDAATGATEEGETEEILPPADIETGAVVARLGELEIDFTHAVAAANAATGKSEADLYRIGLSSDAFMILYDIRYLDDTRLLVDGVTGAVVVHGEDATATNTVTAGEIAAAIARAETIAGPTWRLLDSEVLITEAGAAWSCFFVTQANARVKQVDFLGDTVVVNQYTPIGRLAEKAAAVRAQLPTIVVGPGEFIADIEAGFPGAQIGFVALDSRTRDGVVRTRWNAVVLTATGDALEYAVDATVPIGAGLRIAQLATPRVVGDLTGDGRVLVDDLSLFFDRMGSAYPPCDFDRDGTVAGSDLAILLRNWG